MPTRSSPSATLLDERQRLRGGRRRLPGGAGARADAGAGATDRARWPSARATQPARRVPGARDRAADHARRSGRAASASGSRALLAARAARGRWSSPMRADTGPAPGSRRWPAPGVMEPFENHTFQPRRAVRRVDLAAAVSRAADAGRARPSSACAHGSPNGRRSPTCRPTHLIYPGGGDRRRVRHDAAARRRALRRRRAPVTGAEAVEAVDAAARAARVAERRAQPDAANQLTILRIAADPGVRAAGRLRHASARRCWSS